MNRFQMFDDVEIIGAAEDVDVPTGTRGSIVLCFEDDSYLIDVGSMESDICDAHVRADNLVLIRRNDYSEIRSPVRSDKKRPSRNAERQTRQIA